MVIGSQTLGGETCRRGQSLPLDTTPLSPATTRGVPSFEGRFRSRPFRTRPARGAAPPAGHRSALAGVGRPPVPGPHSTIGGRATMTWTGLSLFGEGGQALLREARWLSRRADKLGGAAAAIDDPKLTSSRRRPAPVWSSWCTTSCCWNVSRCEARSQQVGAVGGLHAVSPARWCRCRGGRQFRHLWIGSVGAHRPSASHAAGGDPGRAAGGRCAASCTLSELHDLLLGAQINVQRRALA